MKSSFRAALCGSLCVAALAAAISIPAQAQSTPQVVLAQTPLSDTDCDDARRTSHVPPLLTGPEPCVLDGTRTVTTISETERTGSAPYPGADPSRIVTGRYHVEFAGALQVDGIPVTFDPGFPYGFPAKFTFPDIATVEATASYDGIAQYSYQPAFGGSRIDPNEIGQWNGVTNVVANATSILIQSDGFEIYDDATNTEFNIRLDTPDPTAIVANSVAFGGTFSGYGDKLVFGKIDGTATLIANPGGTLTPSPYTDENGDPLGGYLSPFALRYAATPVITTQLDENGLITPKVAVSEGIDMNGSRVTNLGAAVDANDAVTLAQLEAAVAGSGAIASGGGDGSSASGAGALAGGDGSTADGAGAVALGLENRATGDGAVAIGDPNLATGTGAVAIGADNTATGNGAVALGNLSTATGDGAVALGNGATAGNAGSVAIGGAAAATGANSVALGAGSVADQANTVSVGAAGAERRVTNVAAGVATTDAVNMGQLAAATGNLAAANTQLQADIDAEATARQTADVQLAGALETEATTRAQVDFQLSQRLAIQEAAMGQYTTGLASESAARLAADNALSARIDAVGSRIDTIDARLSLLDDRISGSTAVATAMSGNAFLPDMKFNLTANVATYDGAHAGSLQVGALVSPHVALNAGVATGFNREGKTAARAGVTIGF